MKYAIFSAFIFLASSSAGAWTVERVQGDVKQAGSAFASGGELKPGMSLATGANSKAFIHDGESEIWLSPRSTIEFTRAPNDDKDEKGLFEVKSGKVRAKFKRPSGPVSFPYEVQGHSVIASVRGTEFMVSAEASEERVATFEGSVRVTSIKNATDSWDVSAGHSLVIKPNEMPKVRDNLATQKKSWLDATTF